MKLSKPPCNLPGIGVFGCNKLSEFLVNSLIKNGFRITAVWSDQLEQARTFAQKFKIEFHTDKIDVLLLKKEVELILINCEQSLYVQIVTKAFRIGKHVFCNWPSRLTVNDLTEMYEAASYYPSLISLYSFPLRFLPQFKLMRSLIQEQNYIGEINLIQANINGRSLIELDTVEQLFNQSNCLHCRKIQADQQKEQQQPEEQPSSIERTDESSIEDQFVDPNKVELLNVKNKQQSNSHNHQSKLKTHPDINHANHPNHQKTHSTNAQPPPARNKADPFVNNLLISLKKRLEVNDSANQKYKELMQSNGLLQSVGPHVIDVISFITNLKAKKCNGILRTFNLSPFSNELSLIKRINVDDFCTFQLLMDKVPQSTCAPTNKQPTKGDERANERSKPNEPVNNKSSQAKFNYKKQAKQLSNNEPIAIVNLNDHMETLEKGYEMIVAGEFGYLRLKNGNLFGRQYEQNNNDGSGNLDSLEEEKAFYLVKDHLKLDNYCILHQNQELSKMIIQNRQPIKPFELGLEKLVESIKNAFDNETVLNGCKTNNSSNGVENDKKNTGGDKKPSDNGIAKDKQANDAKETDDQPNSLKENNVKPPANNQSNGYHSTIVQVNNERNLATQPLKEMQTNSSDLIIPPRANSVSPNGSESKPVVKFNGTTTIAINQPNGTSNGSQEKVQQNGVRKPPTQEPVINGKQPTNGVARKETLTKSTVKTQQIGSSSSNDSSLSSIDSNETAVIGQRDVDKPMDEKNAQLKLSADDGSKCCNRWFKEAVLLASNFEDGKYVLSVIEAIRSSSRLCEWTRVQNYLPKKQ